MAILGSFREQSPFIREATDRAETPWHCILCNSYHKDRDAVLKHLNTDLHKAQVARHDAAGQKVEAETAPKASDQYRVSGLPDEEDEGSRRTIKLFANYQLVHHEIVESNLVFGITSSNAIVPEVNLKKASASDNFIIKLATYMEGGDVCLEMPGRNDSTYLSTTCLQAKKMLRALIAARPESLWLGGWVDLLDVVGKDSAFMLRTGPERFLASVIFSESPGFELSYPVYRKVRDDGTTDCAPMIFIRSDTHQSDELQITSSKGPSFAYLGVTRERAEEICENGIKQRVKDEPIFMSISIPSSPLEQSNYDLSAEVCVTVNLRKFVLEGGVAHATSDGSVKIQADVPSNCILSAVNKATGFDSLVGCSVIDPEYDQKVHEASIKNDRWTPEQRETLKKTVVEAVGVLTPFPASFVPAGQSFEDASPLRRSKFGARPC